jgi:hypothetical protein
MAVLPRDGADTVGGGKSSRTGADRILATTPLKI